MDQGRRNAKEAEAQESSSPFLETKKDVVADSSVSADEAIHTDYEFVDLESSKGRKVASLRVNDGSPPQRYLGLVYTLLSTNCFSLSSTVMKSLSHMHPFNVGVWSTPIAALLSSLFILHTLKIQKGSVLQGVWPLPKHKKVVFIIWVRAVTSSLISYTLILSFKYITVADTRTIMAASVVTVSFFGWLWLGESCGIVPVITGIIALCGIGVMTRPPILTGGESFEGDTLVGVALALLCLLLATVIILTLRFLKDVHHGLLNTVLYTWAFGQSLVLATATGVLKVPETERDAFLLASVGVLLTGGHTLLVLALQTEEAGVVALIRTSEVIFTFFWQWVILDVQPDLLSVLGAMLVVTGVIIVTLRKYVADLDPKSITRRRLRFLLK